MIYSIYNKSSKDKLSFIIPGITSILGFIRVYLMNDSIWLFIAIGFAVSSLISLKRFLYYKKYPYIIIDNNNLKISTDKNTTLDFNTSEIDNLKNNLFTIRFSVQDKKVIIYKTIIEPKDKEILFKTLSIN